MELKTPPEPLDEFAALFDAAAEGTESKLRQRFAERAQGKGGVFFHVPVVRRARKA